MRLYQILIAVNPYFWIGLAEIENYADHYHALVLLQEFDYHYNSINMIFKDDYGLLQKATEYANRTTNSINRKKYPAERNDIIKHFIYISSTLKGPNMNPYDVNREKVFLNIYVTMLAYNAAVNFRVCVIYFSTVEPENKYIINLCQEMFAYMEWFFSFLFAEKVNGLCRVDSYPQSNDYEPPENNKKLRTNALSFQYTAALVCQKLKTLNLSFLKSMNDTKQTPALKKNSHNVFKPNAFRPSSFHSANRFFVPLFPENKISTGILSEQKEKIYYEIWNKIINVYTENFSIVWKYLLAVFDRVPFNSQFKLEMLIPSYKYSTIIWKNIYDFQKIKSLPINKPRETYFKYGKMIYRSNAVEILRQLKIIKICQAQNSTQEERKNLYRRTTYRESKYILINAPEDLGVDYFISRMV